MGARKEADLYGPVKHFLESQGFTVRGEVNGCDLMAVRDDDVVLVELKVAFNLTLVLQGIERQRTAETVYLAVEAPRSQRSVPRWAEMQRLCRRLELGLLTVSFADHREPRVDVLLDPGPYTPKRNVRGRKALLKEFQNRSGDHNTGGVNRRPIVTAYREAALMVADHLHQYGPAQVKSVRKATGAANTGTILSTNVYGWFERERPGIYRVTPSGEQALALYADVLPHKQGPEQ